MARSAAQFRSRQIKVAGPQRRPKLTGKDLEVLASKMCAAYKWEADPKPFQLAGVQAQLEGVDVVIQASTGAGKTAIAAGPYLWPSSAGKSTIMVCPLLSLEEEMVQTFDLDFALKAVAVNSKNGACSPLVIKRILAGTYQIILISPEMLQSRVFINRVLRNTRFCRRILSIVIDEAHCVSHWGADFRKKYGTLGIVRAFLPRGTPVIGFSATLSPRVRRDFMSKLNFPKGGGHFLNVGNDRTNVSIVVRACEHPLNSYADTDFIIPPDVRCAADVLKTYVYSDNIHVGTQIIDHLRTRLLRTSSMTLEEATATIRPFNATMSHSYRTESMDQFRAGVIRILVCTDAAGMGCNIPDVDLVVQWKLPATLSHFIQRAGRAARTQSRSGLAVLLVERSAFSPPDPSSTRPRFNLRKTAVPPATNLPSAPPIPDFATTATIEPSTPERLKHAAVAKQAAKVTKKTKKEYAEAHGLLRGTSSALKDTVPSGAQPALSLDAPDEGLSVFVQSVECRRKVWARVYESEHCDPSVDCCDICVPALLNQCRPGTKPTTTTVKAIKKGQPAAEFSGRLEEWRAMVYERDHPGSQWDSTGILDTPSIEHLISVGRLDNSKLAAILRGSWLWWDEYATELTELVSSWDVPFVPIPRKKPQPGGTKSSKRPANSTAVGQAKSKRARQGDTTSEDENLPLICEWIKPSVAVFNPEHLVLYTALTWKESDQYTPATYESSGATSEVAAHEEALTAPATSTAAVALGSTLRLAAHLHSPTAIPPLLPHPHPSTVPGPSQSVVSSSTLLAPPVSRTAPRPRPRYRAAAGDAADTPTATVSAGSSQGLHWPPPSATSFSLSGRFGGHNQIQANIWPAHISLFEQNPRSLEQS